MAGWLSAALTQLLVSYGPIAIGVMLGIAGRYGQTLHEADRLQGQSLRADVLQFGFLSLIATSMSDAAHLEGTARVMAAALCGAAGERLYRTYLSRFFKRTEADAPPASDLADTARASPGTVVEIPAGAPDTIRVRSTAPDDPAARIGATLREGFHQVAEQRPPDDQIVALMKMKGPASPGGKP